MTLQLEYLELKCESMGTFLSRVNERLTELKDSVKHVQIISNDYRPSVIAIIVLESYTTQTQENQS